MRYTKKKYLRLLKREVKKARSVYVVKLFPISELLDCPQFLQCMYICTLNLVV